MYGNHSVLEGYLGRRVMLKLIIQMKKPFIVGLYALGLLMVITKRVIRIVGFKVQVVMGNYSEEAVDAVDSRISMEMHMQISKPGTITLKILLFISMPL